MFICGSVMLNELTDFRVSDDVPLFPSFYKIFPEIILLIFVFGKHIFDEMLTMLDLFIGTRG